MIRVLGIVTARGGSKGIPGKNIAPLRGKPLLAYTADAARAARRLTRTVLSTDDPEIARVGREYGLEVPFLRPAELARDETPTVPVLQHAVRELEAQGERYDAILTLQPTNPLRRPEDIDGAIELLEATGADSVISFVDTEERHPARMKFISPEGRVIDPPFAEQYEGERRQDLPRLYLREGSIYLTRRFVLMEQNSLKGADCRAWIIPVERACNIDTPFDLLLAEHLLAPSAGARPGGPCDQDPAGAARVGPGAATSSRDSGSLPAGTPDGRAGEVTIVVTESDGFSPAAADLLRQFGKLVLAEVDRAGLLQAVAEADALWVRLRHQIDAEVLTAAPRLRVIATPTTGLDHVDLKEAHRRGIRVLSLRGETEFLKEVRATAELTVSLILALLRHVPAAVEHVVRGGWDRDRFRGRELFGKTAGIVGYGRLGTIVARYLCAFDMRVLAVDPHRPATAADPGVELVSFDDLLSLADVVSLHVNLCERTRGFWGKEEFARMKRGAWFINTARGELVDQAALLEALRSGQLGGAALDVVSGERRARMRDHPLVAYARRYPNLLITPHIGGCTEESMEKTEFFLAQKLCAAL